VSRLTLRLAHDVALPFVLGGPLSRADLLDHLALSGSDRASFHLQMLLC
jgi:hypothetical protein